MASEKLISSKEIKLNLINYVLKNYFKLIKKKAPHKQIQLNKLVWISDITCKYINIINNILILNWKKQFIRNKHTNSWPHSSDYLK